MSGNWGWLTGGQWGGIYGSPISRRVEDPGLVDLSVSRLAIDVLQVSELASTVPDTKPWVPCSEKREGTLPTVQQALFVQ